MRTASAVLSLLHPQLLKLMEDSAKLKSFRTKVIEDLASSREPELSNQVAAFRQVILAQREVYIQEKDEALCTKQFVEWEQQIAFTCHEYLVDHHMISMCSICRCANTAVKTAAAVEEHSEAVRSQCSALDRQVGEHPKR